MRCTKCHYLSFDPEPRCRNCGHDLSLEEGAAFGQANSTLDERAQASGSSRRASAVMAPPRSTTSSSRIPTADLPLFVRSIQGVSDELARDGDADEVEAPEDFEPMVKVPARPRTPVSVRRTTPDPARLRAKYGLSPTQEPDLWSNMSADPIDQVNLHDDVTAFRDLPLTSGASASWSSESSPTPDRVPVGWNSHDINDSVGAAARLMAALIDASLLAGISAAVVYFTLQVTGLSIAQIGLLPPLPLAGLLLLMVAGYLLMFTAASGQTLGKMAMHIRVVGTSPDAAFDERLSVSQAALRALMTLPSVLLLGVGFVPALAGAGLALHDRIAHTRVVRL